LTSASLAVWRGPRASIIMLVVGGFLIFPATELLIRAIGERGQVSSANALRSLGMQIAFVLPLSMPLLLPVGLYRLNWFYPAMMILLGAHYLPFVFLYGMRMFAVLAAFLIGGGTFIAMYFSASFSIGAWYAGTILLVFAELGRRIVNHEYRANAHAAQLFVQQNGSRPVPSPFKMPAWCARSVRTNSRTLELSVQEVIVPSGSS
jgi:Zn-dependent protease with chaperone function